jgi:hypothetical protein
MRGYLKGILALVSLGSLVSGGWLLGQNAPVKNVVLVHGAFADGSSWSKVIPLLQAKGLHVTSVEPRSLRLQLMLQRPSVPSLPKTAP